MSEEYVLEKWVWTDADFERMGWHDAPIRAMAYLSASYQVAFDIDYILQWVHPGPGERAFHFWITPATLIFDNASGLEVELESSGSITVQDLDRSDPRPTREDFAGPETHWLWTFRCLEGEIRLRATGYRQTIRRAPLYQSEQIISLANRGGISFGERP